jgi:hypothetical protein
MVSSPTTRLESEPCVERRSSTLTARARLDTDRGGDRLDDIAQPHGLLEPPDWKLERSNDFNAHG